MRLLPALAVPLLLVPAVARPQDTTLCSRLAALAADPSVSSAHWGVSVRSAGGTPVCALNDAQLFRPASNNKLFTSAAAFALLGAGGTVDTTVLGDFDAATGTVRGDLTLRGAGDSNLDSGDLPYKPRSERGPAQPFRFHDLDDLAGQLAARGVRIVSGDVVGDDSLFPDDPYPPSWNADDLVWGYGAPVAALTLADNQLPLTVTPTTPGAPASVTLDQHGVPFYSLEADVRTVAAGVAAGVGVKLLPGNVLRVFGTVAAGEPDTEEVALAEPALYAAMAFREALLAHGITVAGQSSARHRPQEDAVSFLTRLQAPGGAETVIVQGGQPAESCTEPPQPPVLATHRSAPLLPDAVFTNKTSQNLHAELLLRRLGLLAPCADGSDVAGARMVRAFLFHAGVQAQDFLLYDGSGLSDHDLVAPRALTQLLVFAQAQPWFAAWRSTLPVGGEDGSLAARFPGAMKGRVVAKTGTLGESRALSGYVTTAGGRTLVFSILVDTHLPGNADRAAMDRMVNLLAAEP